MTLSAGPAGASANWADSGFTGLAAENVRLRAESARRHLVDLATGVLAAQLGFSVADAAAHLEALAQATGIPPVDLAADVVNSVAAPGDPPVAPGPVQPLQARQQRRTAAAAETTDSVSDAARTLLEGALGPLGADSLWLWRLTGAGCLSLAGHAGVGAAEAAAWRWISPAVPEPFRSALVGSDPLWLENGPAAGCPTPGARADAARALLPLRRQGETVGLALVGWPGPTLLDPAVRSAVADLMGMAVRVLDLPDSEQPAVPVLVDLLDALTRPAALLRTSDTTGAVAVEHVNAAAVAALGGALSAHDRHLSRAFPLTHQELTSLVRRARHGRRPQRAARLPAIGRTEPGEAPAPLLDVRVLPAGNERTLLLWNTASDSGLAAERAVSRLQSVATFQDSLTGGETVWSEQAYAMFGMERGDAPVPLLALRGRIHQGDDAALTELLRALMESRTGAQSVLRIVRSDGSVRHIRVAAEPLLEGETVTGFVGVYQDESAIHRTELVLSATFDSLTAVRDQAALRHRLALQLQQAIVPEVPDLQELPGGLVVAARYRPAAEEYQVGGDWYDVLPLPGGKVLVTVGDIAGHGIDSVTDMVALRNAQRALAFTGRPPGQVLGWLNEVALRTGEGTTATAVCAMYDPDAGDFVWSSAGHLPLLLLRDGRARLLETPPDVLLGAVPSSTYHERRIVLRPMDTLLLYTDGLIERRHDGLDLGLARLVAAVEELAAGGSLGLLIDGLIGLDMGDTDDDTCIVAVGVR
ncbi:SpoIIE family protein phosphatase [Streptomyces diastatochromogenes]|uniref:Phosphatase n=1 Tax=Streptomyces diastatochromogenes TaxID=42236 RepID=A0A233RRA4_STRDA|nr:SpoIIE family protein phosphatase [Streptomyces diastatochromogenes]OXY85929.1 phosphatase [Streptomyces diastatochromogenes]